MQVGLVSKAACRTTTFRRERSSESAQVKSDGFAVRHCAVTRLAELTLEHMLMPVGNGCGSSSAFTARPTSYPSMRGLRSELRFAQPPRKRSVRPKQGMKAALPEE